MLLAIDVGNTKVKAAVFENNTLLSKEIFDLSQFKNTIEKILVTYPVIKNMIVASVGKIDKNTFLYFEKKVKVRFVTSDSNFPFQNLYSTPKTLGIDRLVLSAGAVLNYPKQNRLVIDAGTCVTYDFIDENDNYLGGAISPGIRLRYEALHNYTANLPLLSKEEPDGFVGDSTNQSIHSGIINGLTLEIDGFINTYSNTYKNFIIILTGGDTDFLAKRLKNTIFANQNFLLESLNQLFQHNNND
ncbi:MAG: type III pantothenate kinase [Bacteroidota bacterium]